MQFMTEAKRLKRSMAASAEQSLVSLLLLLVPISRKKLSCVGKHRLQIHKLFCEFADNMYRLTLAGVDRTLALFPGELGFGSGRPRLRIPTGQSDFWSKVCVFVFSPGPRGV